MTALNDGLPLNGFLPVSAESAQALAESMDDSGVGILHDIVPEAILTQMRSFVAHQIEQHNGQYFGLEGEAWIVDTCLNPLFEDAGFHALLRSSLRTEDARIAAQRPDFSRPARADRHARAASRAQLSLRLVCRNRTAADSDPQRPG
jgi:hypothetical protein